MIDKKNPTIAQMVIVLLLIAVVCSAGVSAVYNATKDSIAQQKAKKEQEALSKVLPEHDNDPTKDTLTIKNENGVYQCFIAKNGNNIVGYAVKSSNNNGYNGKVEVLVGMQPNGVIINTQATVLNETPGLGQKAIEPAYHDQYNGKDPKNFKLEVTKAGGDVEAIAAATITSKAYAKAVNLAYAALMGHLGENVDTHSGATSSANPNADESALEGDQPQEAK